LNNIFSKDKQAFIPFNWGWKNAVNPAKGTINENNFLVKRCEANKR